MYKNHRKTLYRQMIKIYNDSTGGRIMKKSGILLILLFKASALLSGCNEKESHEESSAVSESSLVNITTESVSCSESITTVLTENKTTTSAAKTTTETKPVSSKIKTVSEKPIVKTTAVKSSAVKGKKPKITHSKTTIEKTKVKKTKTAKSKRTTVRTKKTKVKQNGFSKADIEKVNSFIKELVKSYGIGTECSDCSKQGVVYLSGNVDVWNGYSWNTPIETAKLKTTDRINEAVRSYINAIYNEWLKDGEMNKNDIKKYSCIYVYWNKTTKDNYDLYLMW